MRRKLIVVLIPIALQILGTQSVFAQTTATISGSVKDETAGMLPGATISITNAETGISREAVTDNDGRYRVTNLNIGQYEVSATMPGFRTAVRRGIALTIGREAVVEFAMSIGGLAEDVTVTGDAALVDTRTGSMGGIVDRDTIMEIPLSGRDLTGLIALQSGTMMSTNTATSSVSGYSKKFSIGGSRVGDNAVLLDGTEVRAFDGGVPAGASGNFLGGEAIQEFKVEKNAYSAEFGGAAGGVINVVSKAGGNAFHGSVYGVGRNAAWDAANFRAPSLTDASGNFIGKDKPDFWRAQYGASAGGRILRNRTFYFANFEGLRQRLEFPEVWTTLSAAARGGRVGNRTVSVNPAVVPYFSLYPLPADAVDLGDGRARYTILSKQPTDEDFYQLRVDHNLSNADAIFGRITRQVSEQVNPGGRDVSFSPRWPASDRVYNTFLTVEHRRIFTSRLLNTFRFGFNRRGLGTFATEDPAVDPALFIVPVDKWPAPLGADPQMGMLSVTGLDNVGSFAGWSDRTTNRFQFISSTVYTRGAHTLKFGADWMHMKMWGDASPAPAGRLFFGSVDTFLQGLPRQFRGAVLPGVEYDRTFSWNTIGLYLQDDWQIHPRLTLNVGVRNDFYTVPTEENGEYANLRDPLNDTEITVLGTRGDTWWENPGALGLSPRVGLSWDPTGAGRTAVRAGFGVFHNLLHPEAFRQAAWRTAPFSLETNLTAVEGTIPFPVGTYDYLVGLGGGQAQLFLFPYDDMGKPRLAQFNVNVQREIFANTAVMVGYAGSRGHELLDNQSLNTAVATLVDGRYVFPAGAARPNRAFNLDLSSVQTKAKSWYNSLQVEVQRRFQAGWQMQLAYTWSKSIDHASAYVPTFEGGGAAGGYTHDMSLAKGLSAFHVSQRLSASGVWQLPGGGGQGWTNALFGGWQLSGILNLSDGVPISISVGANTALSALGLGAQKPDLVPGGDSNPVIGDPDHYFDASQFMPAPARTIGNLGRNTLIAPGLASVDMGLSKNIPVGAGKVQIRFETFNLLNRTNLGLPTTQVFGANGAPTAGVGFIGTTSTTARQLQLGLRYDW